MYLTREAEKSHKYYTLIILCVYEKPNCKLYHRKKKTKNIVEVSYMLNILSYLILQSISAHGFRT